MKNTFAILLAASLGSSSLLAEGETWLGPERSSWEQTDARKIENDFAGALLVTSDLDWQQKWETSPETITRFNEAKTVRVGEAVVILTFFANPKVNERHEAYVQCGIKVTRPDGSSPVAYEDFPCLAGPLNGDPEYVRLSPAIINFVGEESDPIGTWSVEVRILDVLRDTELNLKTSFVLEKGNG